MKVRDPQDPSSEDLSGSLHESISEITGNVQTAGDLLAGITQDLSKLIRLEIELAKQELVEIARPKMVAAGLAALGVVLALMIVPFMLLTAFEIFDTFMPRWLAAMTVTILITATSGGIFFLAKKKLEGTFVPEKTVKSVKITLRTLKESVKWAKRPKR
ncbi:MAG TPA: phage holin family protein [Fimbriimonadaceae bacterium]|nr:phage holin family protein [Fimbriimonadaceae bacterium]